MKKELTEASICMTLLYFWTPLPETGLQGFPVRTLHEGKEARSHRQSAAKQGSSI